LRSKAVKGPAGQDLYWFGTPKDCVDFVFILSNLTANFFVSENPDYPNDERYDFYCSDCFMAFMKEAGDYGRT
jgi:hypothetical protein